MNLCEDAPVTPAVAQALEVQRKLHAFRWEELCESLLCAVQALLEHGVTPLLLKGAGCVGALYNPPHLRPMRDLDLLVHKSELAVSRSALEAAGFRPSRWLPEKDYEQHHHVAPLFHEETGVCLELHHHPLAVDAQFAGLPQAEEYRQGALPSRVAPGALVLEPTLLLLVTCLHHTHGDHIANRVTHLFDVARLLELSSTEIDWERIGHYAGSAAVASSLVTTFTYLELEGRKTAPAATLDELFRRSRLRTWELRMLVALTNRYRTQLPGPWKLVSSRIANILWRRVLERRPFWKRCYEGLDDVFSRGRRSRGYRRQQRSLPGTGPETNGRGKRKGCTPVEE